MGNSFNILLVYLKTILKATPWFLGGILVLVIVAKQYIKYAKPYYQSTAILKIDEGTVGISVSNLYKDFDLFTAPNNVMTEIEVLKSHNLIKKTIEKLHFDIEYYQVGKINVTELYNRSPFSVAYHVINPNVKYQKEFHIQIKGESILIDKTIQKQFNDTIVKNNILFIVSKHDSLLQNNPNIVLNGNYKFIIKDIHQVAKEVKKNIDITAIDKDISIVRVSFKHQVPGKTNILVNKLAENYIQNYIDNRTDAADKSLQFISKQLNDVTIKLSRTENKLENYKLRNGIVNIRQETETGLRKLSQLKIQLTNMEIKQSALDSLDIYINSKDKNFLDLAPHFEVFGDLLYVELIKKIHNLRAKRKELLINYTAYSEEIKTLDSKLGDLITYFKESVKNSKQNINTQKNQMINAIREAEKEFENSPTLEKNLTVLKREFQQAQKLYTFLSEKKSEALLAKSAGYSFHKILEHASTPKRPVSPNKTLITFVCGFLGAFIGIGLFYIKLLIAGNTIHSIEKVERHFSGNIYSITNTEKQSWVTKLILRKAIKKHQILTISHLTNDKHSIFFTEEIGESFAHLGWKTLILNLDSNINWKSNISTTSLDKMIENNNLTDCLELNENLFALPTSSECNTLILLNHNNLSNVLKQLKEIYDIIIIHAPSIIDHIETVKLASITDHTSCIGIKKKTNIEACTSIELIKEEYKLKKISFTLKQ